MRSKYSSLQLNVLSESAIILIRIERPMSKSLDEVDHSHSLLQQTLMRLNNKSKLFVIVTLIAFDVDVLIVIG